MTALSHATRYPGARASTLARLIVQERKTEQLMAEVANGDHVESVLIAELETALTGFHGEAIDMPAGASAAREVF